MKKQILLFLFSIISFSLVYSQSLNLANVRGERTKPGLQNTVTTAKSLSGSVSCTTKFIPGAQMVLQFKLDFTSTDAEYLDGVSLTFPDGIVPLSGNTSNPLTTPNGCTDVTIDLQPITGQTVVWGQVSQASQCGALQAGIYYFNVEASISSDLTEDQQVSFLLFGDGYGAAPHSVQGMLTISKAFDHDAGLLSTNFLNFYNPGTDIIPSIVIKNFGIETHTFDVQLDIKDADNLIVFTDMIPNQTIQSNEIQSLNFQQYTTSAGQFTAIFTLTPTDDDSTNNSLTASFSAMETMTTYGWNAYDPTSVIPTGPITVQLPNGMLTSIASVGGDFMAGADFVNDVWYGITNTGKLHTIDKTTGEITLIGSSGLGATGLAYDVTTSTLFASVYAAPSSKLYTIDMSNGNPTLIGNIADDIVIGIAIDNAGKIYGISLADKLFEINKTTGAGTEIGLVGLDLNYAQDIAYDRNNDVLYGTLYAGTGLLASIDTQTGAATTLATIGAEVTGFAIPYNFTLPDNDVMVASISPIASGCGMSSEQQIQIIVKNNGINSQSVIPVYYTINGGTQVAETINTTINSGETFTYIFTQKADFSIAGTYVINVCTTLLDDENINNDCKSLTVKNYSPVNTPFTMGFEPTDDFSNWKIFDVNNDGMTWGYNNTADFSHTGEWFAWYLYNETVAANDWLISTCIELKAQEVYTLSFWHRVGQFSGVTYDEKLKVAYGTQQTSDGMSTIIKDLGTLNNITYVKSTNQFEVPADGIYYIGWNVYSPMDKYYLLIDDITIDKTTSIKNYADVKYSIYPNPAQNIVNVESDNYINSVRIINNIGQIVAEVTETSKSFNLAVENLPNGFYFVQITTNKGISNSQLIISR